MITNHVTQSVTIANTQMLVRDCQVSRSLTERVGTIELTVELDVVGASNYALAVLGATVNVTHAEDGGPSITETGEVVKLEEVNISGAMIKRLRCRTQEAKMRDIRVLKAWENQLAGEVAQEIVDLHPDISAGSIVDSGIKVGRVASRYDSLYDCLEQLRQQTGLAWRVSNGQLSLFDPATVSGPIIERIQIMRGSANVTTSIENVVNVARIQAFESKDFDLCIPACFTRRQINLPGRGWELDGQIEKSPLYFPDDFNINLNSKLLTWKQNPYPFYVRFKVRRVVWVQLTSPASIAVYGRKEAPPLYHDGGTGTDAAYSVLSALLDRYQWPTLEVGGVQPINFGHDVDSRCRLLLPDQGIDRQVEITRVTRTYSRNEFVVSVDVRGLLDD
jgi:hypothetical protein